jgi:uncharacterized protein YdaU (DUF1376 family)
MPKKPPTVGVWMPLYITDYLGDTMHLTTEQHGAYLLLLMACWKADGRVPGDPLALASIVRMSPQQWAKTQPVLERFFLASEGYWTHKRVLEELAKAKTKVAKASKAGATAARARWGLGEGGN